MRSEMIRLSAESRDFARSWANVSEWVNGGAVAEWSKALAWKVSIRQKRIQGSNPCRSAKQSAFCRIADLLTREMARFCGLSEPTSWHYARVGAG